MENKIESTRTDVMSIWKEEFIIRVQFESKSGKQVFTFRDARNKPSYHTKRDKAFLSVFDFLSRDQLRNNDYVKYVTCYNTTGKKLNPKYFRNDLNKLDEYYKKVDEAKAKGAFATLKQNSRSEWYYPANYYYGCCAFFEGKYDEAQKAFQICEQSDKYKQFVPYYIAQIYAAKKQYDLVISYGEPGRIIRGQFGLGFLFYGTRFGFVRFGFCPQVIDGQCDQTQD